MSVLPPELLLLVANELAADIDLARYPTLARLASTSRGMRALVAPVLYNITVLNGALQTSAFIASLLHDASLGGHVRVLVLARPAVRILASQSDAVLSTCTRVEAVLLPTVMPAGSIILSHLRYAPVRRVATDGGFIGHAFVMALVHARNPLLPHLRELHIPFLHCASHRADFSPLLHLERLSCTLDLRRADAALPVLETILRLPLLQRLRVLVFPEPGASHPLVQTISGWRDARVSVAAIDAESEYGVCTMDFMGGLPVWEYGTALVG